MVNSKVFKGIMLSLGIAPSLWAAPLKITTGSVSFLATGKPGFLKINGTGADISGTLDKGPKGITGELSVPMAKFVTGIDLRDEHMKEKYFEVKKYPEAILKITEFETDGSGQAKEKPFKGTLNFHGVQRDVVGVASVANEGAKQNIEANFPIVLSDYKIDIPSYAGVKVADKVEVQAKLQTEEGK